MTIKKPADFYAALVLLAAMGVVYHQSLSVDTSMIIAMGPLFVPKILMGAICFLAVCLGYKSLDFSGAAKEKQEGKAINREGLILQGATIGLLLAYLILLPIVSYVPATIAFLFIAMVFLGERTRKNIIGSAIVACAVTGCLYFIFAKVLLLFLP